MIFDADAAMNEGASNKGRTTLQGRVGNNKMPTPA